MVGILTTYKYWMFYILPIFYKALEDSFPIVVDQETYIYAYTDTESIADLFRATHKMEMFKEKKLKLSREEVNALALEEQNKMLRMQSLDTYRFGSLSRVQLPLTFEERRAIENDIRSKLMKCSLKLNLSTPKIFSDKVIASLRKLKYQDFWDYQQGDIIGAPFESMTFHLDMDELHIYTEIFSQILREE